MSMPTPGSLLSLMDELMVMYETLNDEVDAYNTALGTGYKHLVISRWRPAMIDPPALYNWMPIQAPFDQQDLARWRDTVTIVARIAVTLKDQEESTSSIEFYADVFRYVVDQAFDNHEPLNNTCKWAKRTAMRFTSDTFNDIEYLVFEAPLEFRIDRIITGS